MRELNKFIKENSEDFLIVDGNLPTLTLGFVKEEMILYNISKTNYSNILSVFKKIAGKEINTDTLISNLSHGQKLILSATIALNSSAQKIKFRNFFTSIDESKCKLIEDLIEKKIQEGKRIEVVNK